jgi:hypothetical protein
MHNADTSSPQPTRGLHENATTEGPERSPQLCHEQGAVDAYTRQQDQLPRRFLADPGGVRGVGKVPGNRAATARCRYGRSTAS